MIKKYFIISDIHGHYDEMIRDLNIHKYNPNNINHHLLVLGDLFDRGTQSKEVLEYMYDLRLKNRVTIILGNHDSFLIQFLDGEYKKLFFNMTHNGFKSTLESLVGRSLTFDENWDDINYEIKSKYIYLYNFISTQHLYIEIGKYIFVHGGIIYNNGDWKNNKERDYTWSRESNLERIPGKIVVSGHERVSKIRFPRMNQEELILKNPDAFNILEMEGKILIDSYVEISKKINVLILELEGED